MGKHRQHRHKADWVDTYCYATCVNPSRCEPRAHGGTVEVESCRCGAVRYTNRNGLFVERGSWKEAR